MRANPEGGKKKKPIIRATVGRSICTKFPRISYLAMIRGVAGRGGISVQVRLRGR